MRKVAVLVIVFCLLFGMGACAKAGKIPSLREIADNGAEWGTEQLRQIPDCTLADLETAWGKAAGERQGEYAYFWKLDDKTSINVHYCKNAEIDYITIDVKIDDSGDSDENSPSDTIYWEFTPLLSSRLPALAFSFDVPCYEITAECNSGSLIDYDHFDNEKGCYPQGKSLAVPSGSSLYWAPFDDEMAESVVAASAELTFSVTNESGTVLYHGTLKITEREKSRLGMIYSASLALGSGLTLAQDETLSGGVLSETASGSGKQQSVLISAGQAKGDFFALTEKESQTLSQFLNGGNWADYGTDCASDCVILFGDRTLRYHSECGTFNESSDTAERSLSLSSIGKNTVNAILGKYISLGGLGDAPIEIKEAG